MIACHVPRALEFQPCQQACPLPGSGAYLSALALVLRFALRTSTFETPTVTLPFSPRLHSGAAAAASQLRPPACFHRSWSLRTDLPVDAACFFGSAGRSLSCGPAKQARQLSVASWLSIRPCGAPNDRLPMSQTYGPKRGAQMVCSAETEPQARTAVPGGHPCCSFLASNPSWILSWLSRVYSHSLSQLLRKKNLGSGSISSHARSRNANIASRAVDEPNLRRSSASTVVRVTDADDGFCGTAPLNAVSSPRRIFVLSPRPPSSRATHP